MEDFAKPENYQGSNLLTIKNTAERIRLEKGKGSALSDFRKKDLTKEKSYSKIIGKVPKDVQKPARTSANNDVNRTENKNTIKRSDYTKLIERTIKRSSSKRESLLIDIDILRIVELPNVGEQSVSNRKPIQTTRILFGLICSKKTEAEIKSLAIKEFIWAVRMVIIWTNYFNIISEKSQHKQQRYLISVKSYKQAEELDNVPSSELHFNKRNFIVTKEIDLTSDMKKTLIINPKQRTEEQINCVMYGLAALEAFNEYPIHLKKKLCKVAYYKKVDPHRVIVRQGHRAEYFYFIISGTAMVTITDRGTERTVNSLSKGYSFGELALLHHSKRTASVVSTSAMQLLAIERSDFFLIFMQAKSELSNYPEHVVFIKEVPIFNHLEEDNITKYSDSCLCHYYKKNSVICTDDKASDWVYIVKSGNCTVVKEIKVPVKGKLIAGNSLSLNDIESRLKCYDNYYFIPTPLDDAVGKIGSKTRYLWRSPTIFKPGDYFYLRKDIDVVEESETQKSTENKNSVSKNMMSVFIEVAHLTAKDFYGLSSVIFAEEDKLRIEDMASVTLVSNGVEMVLISKKYFSQNSNEMLIKDIRQGISQYPSEEVFLETYNTRVNWEKYRIRNYETTVKNIAS